MRSYFFNWPSATLVILLLTLPACNTSESPSTPTPPNPPSQAQILIGATATSVDASPAGGFTYRVTVAVPIQESAGVGANMNFVRFQFFIAGASPDETRQFGASEIIAQTGSNRIEGNSSRNLTLAVDFNTDGLTTALMTIDFTDDRGNSIQEEADFDLPAY